MSETSTSTNQPLTFNEQMVRKIRAAIQEAIESGAESATMSNAGNSNGYKRYSLEQLQAMEGTYLSRVDAERRVAAKLDGFVKPDFGDCQ